MFKKTFNLFLITILLFALIAINTLTEVKAQPEPQGFQGNPLQANPGLYNPISAGGDGGSGGFPNYVENKDNDVTPLHQIPEKPKEEENKPSAKGLQRYCRWCPYISRCSWWQQWFCWSRYREQCLIVPSNCYSCSYAVCVPLWWRQWW
ncbi:hypothetical protein G9A89_004912 [Geosiphon pyriformis]|nr:hypothetical protein G9A89_004912 [Geosiphon pyriformis]